MGRSGVAASAGKFIVELILALIPLLAESKNFKFNCARETPPPVPDGHLTGFERGYGRG